MANATLSVNLSAGRGGNPNFPGREALCGGVRL